MKLPDSVNRFWAEMQRLLTLLWKAAFNGKKSAGKRTTNDTDRVALSAEYARGYINGWQECSRICVPALELELGWPSEAMDRFEWIEPEQPN
jgi:hypothetical protein